MKKLIFILFILLVVGCGTEPVGLIEKHIANLEGGKVFAKVGKYTLSLRAVKKEYLVHVKYNYPKSLWKEKFKDDTALRVYGEKMAIQLLLIVALKKEKNNYSEINISLLGASREALSEIYLRKKTDLSSVIGSKQFKALNEKMIDKLYSSNKKKYAAKKISEKVAKQSLRYVMMKRKTDYLKKYLYDKRLKLIQGLMKKTAYDVKYTGNAKKEVK